MRAIDGDALWMEIIHRMDYCDDILEIIESMPTIEPERKTGKYHDPFGNPIYVYVRVGDKTVAIKADDLQKALDYVAEHGEEVTIEGRREMEY